MVSMSGSNSARYGESRWLCWVGLVVLGLVVCWVGLVVLGWSAGRAGSGREGLVWLCWVGQVMLGWSGRAGSGCAGSGCAGFGCAGLICLCWVGPVVLGLIVRLV